MPPKPPAKKETAEPPAPKQMVQREVFTGKQATIREATTWVLQHLYVEVDPADAPSAEAWSLLQWARTNRQELSMFFTTFVVKFLPSKNQMESEERYRDDGRSIQAMLDAYADTIGDPVLPSGSEESA
jgi:hypothetical protein